MLEASPAYASDSKILSKVAETIEAYAIERGNGARFDAICTKISDKTAFKLGLLIIDEAQHLRPSQVENIRCIHDRTKCAVIPSGNPHVTNRYYQRDLKNRNRLVPNPRYAQITSRFAKILPIESSSEDDVAAICAHFGIEDDRAKDRLWPFAIAGGLRTVCQMLEQARDIAGEGGITFDHVHQVACLTEA